jgi:hypothetical protein
MRSASGSRSDGSPMVAGVLSTGSATCTGEDHYARLDAVGDWLRGVIGPFEIESRECGTVSSEGPCLYGNAVWCAAWRLSDLAPERVTRSSDRRKTTVIRREGWNAGFVIANRHRTPVM